MLPEFIFITQQFNFVFNNFCINPENPKGIQVIVGSMNMGYDIIPEHFTVKTHPALFEGGGGAKK